MQQMYQNNLNYEIIRTETLTAYISSLTATAEAFNKEALNLWVISGLIYSKRIFPFLSKIQTSRVPSEVLAVRTAKIFLHAKIHLC
jgi:hypothetical protein